MEQRIIKRIKPDEYTDYMVCAQYVDWVTQAFDDRLTFIPRVFLVKEGSSLYDEIQSFFREPFCHEYSRGLSIAKAFQSVHHTCSFCVIMVPVILFPLKIIKSQSKLIEVNEMAGKERFEKVYSQGTMNIMEIWVDKETGVNYVFHAGGYAEGNDTVAG